jgi:hypothetical protein
MPQHQHCNTTTLQHLNTTMSQHCNTTMPQHHTLTTSQREKNPMSQNPNTTMPQHPNTTIPQDLNSTIPQHDNTTLPQHRITTVTTSHHHCIEMRKHSYTTGVGKLTSPLSANANALPATFRFPSLSAPIMMLACYQQAGRVGKAESSRKYVGVSRKWGR